MARHEVTSSDNGRTISVRPRDEIVVVLPENATTGFRWAVDSLGDAVTLTQDGYPSPDEPPRTEQVFGRGGLREFRFEVVSPGTTTLTMKLWREWEGDASVVEHFALVVDAG